MNYFSNQSSESLYPRFLRLAGINILSNLMIPLAGLVDIAFLGHLSEIRYLAGVSLGTVIFDVLYRNCNLLRLVTTGPTAQAEGRDDVDGVALVLLRNGLISLGLGVLILSLQHPLGDLGLAILDPSSEVKLAAEDYFNARIWGAPAAIANMVLIGWFLGREQSGKVLLLSILGSGGNIVLDYLLIYRWDWASAGAGTATAVSQYIMLLVALFWISREPWWSGVSITSSQIFDTAEMRSSLTLKGNIWIRILITTLTLTIFTKISAAFGTNILTINSLLYQVLMVTFYIIEGLSFATERLSGLFLGLGNTQNFGSLLRISTSACLTLGGAIALFVILLPEPVFSMLTNHLEIISELKHYIIWLLPLLLLTALTFMLEGYFLGLTEGAILRNAVLGGCIFGFLPLAFTAYQIHNTHLLWLAFCLYMALRVVILGSRVPSTLTQSELNMSS